MKFKIKMRDNTIIYANDICIFNTAVRPSLTTWKKEGSTMEIDRWIPLEKVFSVEVDGILIYC